jgi:hypothetical protein
MTQYDSHVIEWAKVQWMKGHHSPRLYWLIGRENHAE